MTKQEAQVWEARLERVWEPGASELRAVSPGRWLYDAELGIDPNFEDHVSLQVIFGETGTPENWIYRLYIHPLFLVWNAGRGYYLETNDLHNSWFSWQEPEQTFINQWMGLFRRGCWLSGCRVEATVHEKAEWMQGLSQQEIEAWNLYF